MLRRVLLGLVGLFLAAGAAAAPTGQAPTDGQAVTIPFEPGVGTVARFRLVSTETETEDGKVQPPIVTRTTEQFHFLSRNAKGYVVEYTSHDPRVEGSEFEARLMQTIVDSIGVIPIRVQLDSSGKAVEVLNLDEVNRTMNRMWDILEAKAEEEVRKTGAPADAIAGMKSIMAGLSAPYRNMTNEVVIEQLLPSLELVGGWGGVRLVQGESIPFRQTVQMDLLQADVDTMGTIDLLSHVPGGSATLKIRSAAEPKALQAAVKAFAARLSAQMIKDVPPEKRAEFEQGFAEGVAQLDKLRLEEEATVTVSLSTGLALTGEHLRRRGTPGARDNETRQTIELIR